MKWVDVMGVSGVGKTTLCTPWCNPNDYSQEPTAIPRAWEEFVDCCQRLCARVKRDGPGGGRSGTWRRTQNAIWRQARIAVRQSDETYMNVGIAHRGLSIAWRLPEIDEIAEFYRLMPVSIGVASLYADDAVVVARNLQRGKTIANKQRSDLALKMESGRPACVAAIKARGIPLIEIDTSLPVKDNVAKLRDFAGLAPLSSVS
jgi:hypothetical protein